MQSAEELLAEIRAENDYNKALVEQIWDYEADENDLIALIERARKTKPTITTSDVLNAYAAFDGDNVAVFTEAWDKFLAGEDEPCRGGQYNDIIGDGLHNVTDGSCDECGAKNREDYRS